MIGHLLSPRDCSAAAVKVPAVPRLLEQFNKLPIDMSMRSACIPMCMYGKHACSQTCMYAWQDYIGKSMALHTRYPGHNGHQPVPNSPLGRVKDIIDAFFATCSHTACVPAEAMPLLAYWNADSNREPYPPPTSAVGSTVPRHVSGPQTCAEATCPR